MFTLKIEYFPGPIFFLQFLNVCFISSGPSRITAKMAFLPPKITYNITEINQPEEEATNSKDKEKELKYDFSFLPEFMDPTLDQTTIKETFDAFFTKTKRGNKIACLYIKNPKKDVK